MNRWMPPKEQTVPFPLVGEDRLLEEITAEQRAEIEAEEIKRLEREAMDEHFRKYPHG